jgi:transposase-like protein
MTKNDKQEIACPNCRSLDIWRLGYRKNRSGKKQKYKCKQCKKYFVIDDGFKGMHFKPEIITRAVHMYTDGMPVLKVQNHLRQHDSTKVSDVSILNWVT